MTTSDDLAFVALALRRLRESGQEDLIPDQSETALALHLRAQVAHSVAQVIDRAAVTLERAHGLHQSTTRSAHDVSVALKRRHLPTPGPAPTDLRLNPPLTSTCRAWTDAARAAESAAVAAGRATPGQRDDWMGALADSFAVADVLSWVDLDLGRAAIWSGSQELGALGERLVSASLTELRRSLLAGTAAIATTRLSNGFTAANQLPHAYDLLAPVRQARAVATVAEIPDGLRAATSILEQDGLTARQHRSLHNVLAALAYRLGQHATAGGEPDLGHALDVYARGHLSQVSAWDRVTSLWHKQPGSDEAVLQVRAVIAAISSGAASGQALRGSLLHHAVAALLDVDTAAAANLHRSLAAENWLAAYTDAAGQTAWDVVIPALPSGPPITPLGPRAQPVDVRLQLLAEGREILRFDVGRGENPGSPGAVTDLERIETLARRTRDAAEHVAGHIRRAQIPPVARPAAESARSVLTGTTSPARATPALPNTSTAAVAAAALARSTHQAPGDAPPHLIATEAAPAPAETQPRTNPHRGR